MVIMMMMYRVKTMMKIAKLAIEEEDEGEEE